MRFLQIIRFFQNSCDFTTNNFNKFENRQTEMKCKESEPKIKSLKFNKNKISNSFLEGKWLPEEHALFLIGLHKYNRDWSKISKE